MANHPINEIEAMLHKGSQSLAEDLPQHIDVIAFINAAVGLLKQPRKGKQLWDSEQVNRTSLYAAIRQAARDGMMLDGREATIVIFGDQAQYMQLVGGIIRKIHNTARCKSITVGVVYDQEPHIWQKGEEEQLHHTPLPPSIRGNTLVAAYAVVKLEGGEVYREWIWAEELADIENQSRNKSMYSGPWREEMQKKAPLRRVSKRMPMSTADLRQNFKTWDADFQVGGEQLQAGDPTITLGEGRPHVAAPTSTPEPTPDPTPEAPPAPQPTPVPPQQDEAPEAPVRTGPQHGLRPTRAAAAVAQARSSQAPQPESVPEEQMSFGNEGGQVVGDDDAFEAAGAESFDGDIL